MVFSKFSKSLVTNLKVFAIECQTYSLKMPLLQHKHVQNQHEPKGVDVNKKNFTLEMRSETPTIPCP